MPTQRTSCSGRRNTLVLGIAEFKRSGFVFGGISPATRIRVFVEPLAIAHELSVAKLQAWLDSNGKTPREQATKVTLSCSGAYRPQSRPTEIAAPINRKIVNEKLPTLSTARDDAK
jgi:hypothetical protein